jgi:hypothetical protein
MPGGALKEVGFGRDLRGRPFGAEPRGVVFGLCGDIVLVHVVRGGDRLWRQHCGAQAYQDDSDGDSLYQALRRLVDGCQELVELEP